jgi:hypothetical protein
MPVQNRVQNGKLFELSLIKDGWIVKPKSPKFKWSGNGRSFVQKMRDCRFISELFILDESSSMCKYDIVHLETNRVREVKKYMKKDLNKWTLYSEPFFKIATRSQQKKIDVIVYNKFANEFYDHNLTTGLFDRVINKMTSCSEGIMVQDGFIPSKDIEFRTELVANQWGGYDRITIQFRIR